MLRGFHLRAAYRMAKINKPRKLDDGEWYYPPSEDVFAEVKVHSIDHYIEKQIQPIADSILPLIGLNFETIANDQLSLF